MDVKGEEVGTGPSCGPLSVRGRHGNLAVNVEGERQTGGLFSRSGG